MGLRESDGPVVALAAGADMADDRGTLKPVVLVEIKEVYGKPVAYPVNDRAKVAAALAGSKTLNSRARELVRDLGFVVKEAWGRSLEGVA